MNAVVNAVFPQEMEPLSESQPAWHEEGLGLETPAALLPPRNFKAPCERDIEIYEEVVFAGKSQRQVATAYRISQPRVNQILRKIAGWMADNTPGFFTGLTQPQRLRLLHYNARKKLEYHEHVLMEAWRGSLAAAAPVKAPGGLLAPRRTPYHDVRYLREARKIIGEILKLEGWVPGTRIPDPPQDSEYWTELEEDGQESEEEEEGRLSPGADLEDEISSSRGEPIPPREGQQATYALIKEKLEGAEARARELEKPYHSATYPSAVARWFRRRNGERPRGGNRRNGVPNGISSAGTGRKRTSRMCSSARRDDPVRQNALH